MKNVVMRLIMMAVLLYWSVFWILNGLEKMTYPELPPSYDCSCSFEDHVMSYPEDYEYFERRNGKLVLKGGFGKNRICQVVNWGVPLDYAKEFLIIGSLSEIIIGLFFLACITLFKIDKHINLAKLLFLSGSFLAIVFFVFLSIQNIALGDRFEVYEDNQYLVGILTTILFFKIFDMRKSDNGLNKFHP